MKRSPVKKKTPPQVEKEEQKDQNGPNQMAIKKRPQLLAMLDSATEGQLSELYGQIMGEKWHHGVAELGCEIREILARRKYRPGE